MAKGKNIPLMKGMPNHQGKMTQDHWEKTQEELGACCDLRYVDKPNPEAQKESTDKLAAYARNNQMKY